AEQCELRFHRSNPNLTTEVHHPIKGEWASFSDYISFKLINYFIGSKLTNSLTVATVLVTKPFIHAGFIRRDKETVKFRMLYQPLTTIAPPPGKENGKVFGLKFPFCAFAPLLLKNHPLWSHFQHVSVSAFQRYSFCFRSAQCPMINAQ
ncbi:MAG: hypothetical protein WCH99_21065, partial [Verrucomicrobiota bacterium]